MEKLHYYRDDYLFFQQTVRDFLNHWRINIFLQPSETFTQINAILIRLRSGIFPFSVSVRLLNFRNVYIFSKLKHYNTKKVLFQLKIREVLTESLKNHHKAYVSRKTRQIFPLHVFLFLHCFFLVLLVFLLRLLLTLGEQFKCIFATAITFQKVPIKLSNFSQCSFSSKSRHFTFISHKFASHFFSKVSDVRLHPHEKP